jgi:hypothetical protein
MLEGGRQEKDRRKSVGMGGLSLGRKRVVELSVAGRATLSCSQTAMSWPSPVNDCWLRNENAAELSYEAARSWRRVLIGKQPAKAAMLNSESPNCGCAR